MVFGLLVANRPVQSVYRAVLVSHNVVLKGFGPVLEVH